MDISRNQFKTRSGSMVKKLPASQQAKGSHTHNGREYQVATFLYLLRTSKEAKVMVDYELHKLRAQVAVLKDVAEVYPTSTIGNCITQIESRIKEIEKQTKE